MEETVMAKKTPMSLELALEEAGVKRINAVLRDKALIAEPLKELFEEAGPVGVEAATSGLDAGTGIAVRSLAFEVKPLEMRVYSAMPIARAFSIEKGRPLHDPKLRLGGIITWKEAVGHTEPAVLIYSEIKQRGVKGRFFMRAARNKISEQLPTLLRAMGQKIAVKWGRK
jgi:hypothetical protein